MSASAGTGVLDPCVCRVSVRKVAPIPARTIPTPKKWTFYQPTLKSEQKPWRLHVFVSPLSGFISLPHLQELKGGKAYAKVSFLVDPSSLKRPCRSSAFTVISRIYTECPEQTDGLRCLHVAARLLPLSWASRLPSRLVLLRPVSFHVHRLGERWLDGTSGLLRSLRVHPLSFSPPSARFCGSEFSRVRRLRKYNPQMSAGRLRYQKYPPGQLYSQGEPKNCCKAATHRSGHLPHFS